MGLLDHNKLVSYPFDFPAGPASIIANSIEIMKTSMIISYIFVHWVHYFILAERKELGELDAAPQPFFPITPSTPDPPPPEKKRRGASQAKRSGIKSPKSSYLYYYQDELKKEKMKQKMGDKLAVVDLAKELGEKWKLMSKAQKAVKFLFTLHCHKKHVYLIYILVAVR